MATANYIAAASMDNVQPVAVLSIETIDTIIREMSSQSDWEGSGTYKSNINTTSSPGSILLTTNGAEATAGNYTASAITVNSEATEYSYPPPDFDTGASSSTNSRTVGTTISGQVNFYLAYPGSYNSETGVYTSNVVFYNYATVSLYGSKSGAAAVFLGSTTVTNSGVSGGAYKSFTFQVAGIEEGSWSFYLSVSFSSIDWTGTQTQEGSYYQSPLMLKFVSHTDIYKTSYASSGYWREWDLFDTVSDYLDMGVVPSVDSVVSIDDTIETGAAIVYTLYGSTDGFNISNVNLGAVVDGSTVAPYRYYRFHAALSASTDLLSTPIVHSLGLTGGDSSWIDFGTHQNVPRAGVKPYLVPGGISSLTSKIDFKKISTTGQITVDLFWNQTTSDLIATGYLKNKAVKVVDGFVGLAALDYADYFVGSIYNWSAIPGEKITLTLQGVLKRFSKIKLPEETAPAGGGAKTTSSLAYSSANVIDVILDIVELCGVPGRYYDSAGALALKSESYSSTDWNVTRTIYNAASGIEETKEAFKLIEELCIIAGVFPVEMPDGKFTLVKYDATATAAASFEWGQVSIRSMDGGLSELFTRQLIYYSPTSGASDPGDTPDDYDNVLLKVNAQAENAWNEHNQQDIFVCGKWGASSAARTALANRFDDRYANPKAKFKVEKIAPRFMDLMPGNLIEINKMPWFVPMDAYAAGTTYAAGTSVIYSGRAYESLQDSNTGNTPSSSPTYWKDLNVLSTGVTDGKKFLITAKTKSVGKVPSLLSFEVLEV